MKITACERKEELGRTESFFLHHPTPNQRCSAPRGSSPATKSSPRGDRASRESFPCFQGRKLEQFPQAFMELAWVAPRLETSKAEMAMLRMRASRATIISLTGSNHSLQ